MELSVVLVNHNGAACLGTTLEALARNTVSEEVECIVVDSGSADGSWEGVEEAWPRARTLRFEENVGFCVGCNRGAEAASGYLLAFVNFDGEVEPGWDTPLIRLLDDPTTDKQQHQNSSSNRPSPSILSMILFWRSACQ